MSSASTSRTVVFLTGAFVHHSCWDDWKQYFEEKGYTTDVTPWPTKEGPDAETIRRRDPDPALGELGIEELTNHWVRVIERQPEPPILIGHSLGGLMVQLMLNRGLGAAGIAIHSAPPQGLIPLTFSFIRAGWGPLGLFDSKKTFLMDLDEWRYAFANGMPEEFVEASYQKLTIPESHRIVREGIGPLAHIDYKKPHAPLLFISGDKDHFFSPTLNRENAEKYKDPNSVSEHIMFPGRNHGVLGLPTWREEADYILDWLTKH